MTIEEKLEAFAPQLELMPGVTVIHDINGFKPLFMTSNGLKLLGISLEELIKTGEDYSRLFFNDDFMPAYLEKLVDMMEQDQLDEAYSFFHQVEIKGTFEWYFASTKVFHRNKKGHPTHSITTALPIDGFEWTRKRAERLLTEQKFTSKNLQKFKMLTKREVQVLKRVALGKSSLEIAEELNISDNTVNSHRKMLKQKLGISSAYQFTEYAYSFDLI